MKLKSSEYNFYTYLTIGKKEDWETCAYELIAQMKRMGYKYNPKQYGDYRREPQGWNDGAGGAPMFFVKKVKRP